MSGIGEMKLTPSILKLEVLKHFTHNDSPENSGWVSQLFYIVEYRSCNATLLIQQIFTRKPDTDKATSPFLPHLWRRFVDASPPSSLGGRRLETRTIGWWVDVGGGREAGEGYRHVAHSHRHNYFILCISRSGQGNNRQLRIFPSGWMGLKKHFFSFALSINASPWYVFVLVLYRGYIMTLISIHLSVTLGYVRRYAIFIPSWILQCMLK